jgi:hypothetical protein
MRIFHCDRCGAVVPFSAQSCGWCDVPLAYVSEERAIRPLLGTSDPAVFVVEGADQPVWRCLNTAWGCNWLTPVESGNEWCRACRLTRGRPDTARREAIEAWMMAESAKRWLLHQLAELSLPYEPRSPSAPDGLAFDLVYLPGQGGITGHRDGLVTLDLAEADDRLRDDLRRRLGEPFRTLIGHLRHEVGHYYWRRLVVESGSIGSFRDLFGDETSDYQIAIERYYRAGAGDWDPTRFVSPYAAAHPFEDWAETFAHYLHIVDATDTAIAHGLVPMERGPVAIGQAPVADFEKVLAAWRPLNLAVSAIAESLGAAPLYPLDPTGQVVRKLSFVGRVVSRGDGVGPGGPSHR